MKMEKEPLNIIICGVGGQGNILASQIVANAGIKQGLKVSIGETYGASQRGGSVMSHIRFARSFHPGPLIPKGEADLIVGFEPLEALRVLVDYGKDETRVIFNPRPNYPISVLSGEARYPELDFIFKELKELAAEAKVLEATELARKAGNHLAQNLVMVGALAGSGWLDDLPLAAFEQVIGELFEDQAKRQLNLRAFNEGVRGISQARPL
jgi:indolepyruvate ferredoxin oxidoreductase beta subunit